MSSILLIAGIEFSRAIKQPVVIAISIILFIIALLNGLGGSILLHEADKSLLDGKDHFLSIGMSNTIWETAIYLSAVAMFIGLLTMAEEKSDGVIRLLITKPLYRRDIIAGKFLGLSALILLLTIIVVILCFTSLFIFYGGPKSGSEFILRILSYMGVMFLYNVLFLAIAMTIGTIFENIFTILVVSGLFYWLQYFVEIYFSDVVMAIRNKMPFYLFAGMLEGDMHVDLFNSILPYSAWLENAWSNILLVSLIIVALLMFNCYRFSRYDT